MNQSSVIKAALAIGSVAASIFAVATSSSKKKNKELSPEQLLKVKDKLYEVKDTDWYCDECNDYLNDQRGFSTKKGSWKCRKCGHVNSIHYYDILNRDN